MLKAVWFERETLCALDQTRLLKEERVVKLKKSKEVTAAIKDMTVRGAGVIGNVAAFGAYFAVKEAKGDVKEAEKLCKPLLESRPTAVNLAWAVGEVLKKSSSAASQKEAIKAAKEAALTIYDMELEGSKAIGAYGLELFRELAKKKGSEPLNILTHCNAGALAILGLGSALAPIYAAKQSGLKIHVWVDETRPRNQGANLTAWELDKAGIPHTVIADNTGGLLMMKGMVDACIVGADRVAANGDVANKIGTYLKALAAHEHNVPFFVALPTSTFDMQTLNGEHIEIEQRSADEVKYIEGVDEKGRLKKLRLTPKNSPAANYGFDVTPAKLVAKLITERGVCDANAEAINKLLLQDTNG